MSDSPVPHATSAADDHLTEEQRADQKADQRVVIGVFSLLVITAVVFVSGWSPQF